MNNDYLDYLQHHGIKGQRWGHRRFQRNDGSLTPAGENRYSSRQQRKADKKAKRLERDTTIKNAREKDETLRRAERDAAAKMIMSKGKGREAAFSAYQKARDERISNDKVASQSTHGEKVAQGLMAGAMAGVAVGMIAAARKRY